MNVFKLHDDKYTKISNNNNFIQTAFIKETLSKPANKQNTPNSSQSDVLGWQPTRSDPTYQYLTG